jgi:hypothetical protein
MAANIDADNAANLAAKEAAENNGSSTGESGSDAPDDASGNGFADAEAVSDGSFNEAFTYDPSKIGLPDEK